MRIVHAIRSDGFAGVERHVSRLAAGQRAVGHDVTVIGGDHAAMAAATGRDDVELVPVADTVWSVATALRRHAPGADVVHVHMTAAELGAGLARALGRRLPPLVTTRHFAAPRGSGPLGRPIAAVARFPVRAQIAVSHYVAEHVDGESTVIYAGVEVQRATAPAAERRREILLVQRLDPEKGAAVGLHAFAASQLADRGWRLTVAGDGAQRALLEALADELGIARATTFLGRVTDVDALMARAAVLLAPSPREHFGLSVVEALAAGLPVVADGSGGHLESLAGVDPHALYPTGDAAAAAERLVALADDEGARDAYGAAAQERQRTAFRIDTQVTETDAVYRTVLT